MRPLFVLLLTAAAAAHAAVPPSVYPADVAAIMDFTADPCNSARATVRSWRGGTDGGRGADFYQYACGGWIANTTLPPQDSQLLRAITNIGIANSNDLLTILQGEPSDKCVSRRAAGTRQLASSRAALTMPFGRYPLINQFFQNCMDTDTIEALGTAPLLPFYEKLNVTVSGTRNMSHRA